MNRSTIISTVFLLILALASFWLIRHSLFRQRENNKVLARIYAIDAVQTNTNKDGLISNRLTAKKIEQFDSKHQAQLTSPQFTYYNQGQPLWVVRADEGTIYLKQSNRVILNHHVKAERYANEKLDALQLTTETLTIDPVKKITSTNAHVTLRQGGTVVNSVGMRANLKTGTIKLLSHTQSTIQNTHVH